MKTLGLLMATGILATVGLCGCEAFNAIKGKIEGVNARMNHSLYSLPFGVKVGGQDAKPLNEVCAKVADPVAADAIVEVAIAGIRDDEQVIINAFASSADGKQVEGDAAAIVLFKPGQPKGSLAEEIKQQKLKSGTYLMNIVVQGQTARVVFTIK